MNNDVMAGENFKVSAERKAVHADQLVTIRDLEEFSQALFAEIRKLLNATGTSKEKKWLKTAEVRRMLEISPGKLHYLRSTGKLAFMRIGGTIYYDRDDIVRMFENNRTLNV